MLIAIHYLTYSCMVTMGNAFRFFTIEKVIKQAKADLKTIMRQSEELVKSTI